jgi:hypothetical protein
MDGAQTGTRSQVDTLPLLQSGSQLDKITQGFAPLHPGLSSFTPSAYNCNPPLHQPHTKCEGLNTYGP